MAKKEAKLYHHHRHSSDDGPTTRPIAPTAPIPRAPSILVTLDGLLTHTARHRDVEKSGTTIGIIETIGYHGMESIGDMIGSGVRGMGGQGLGRGHRHRYRHVMTDIGGIRGMHTGGMTEMRGTGGREERTTAVS